MREVRQQAGQVNQNRHHSPHPPPPQPIFLEETFARSCYIPCKMARQATAGNTSAFAGYKTIGPRAKILECRAQNECRANAPLGYFGVQIFDQHVFFSLYTTYNI